MTGSPCTLWGAAVSTWSGRAVDSQVLSLYFKTCLSLFNKLAMSVSKVERSLGQDKEWMAVGVLGESIGEKIHSQVNLK